MFIFQQAFSECLLYAQGAGGAVGTGDRKGPRQPVSVTEQVTGTGSEMRLSVLASGQVIPASVSSAHRERDILCLVWSVDSVRSSCPWKVQHSSGGAGYKVREDQARQRSQPRAGWPGAPSKVLITQISGPPAASASPRTWETNHCPRVRRKPSFQASGFGVFVTWHCYSSADWHRGGSGWMVSKHELSPRSLLGTP